MYCFRSAPEAEREQPGQLVQRWPIPRFQATRERVRKETQSEKKKSVFVCTKGNVSEHGGKQSELVVAAKWSGWHKKLFLTNLSCMYMCIISVSILFIRCETFDSGASEAVPLCVFGSNFHSEFGTANNKWFGKPNIFVSARQILVTLVSLSWVHVSSFRTSHTRVLTCAYCYRRGRCSVPDIHWWTPRCNNRKICVHNWGSYGWRRQQLTHGNCSQPELCRHSSLANNLGCSCVIFLSSENFVNYFHCQIKHYFLVTSGEEVALAFALFSLSRNELFE